MAYYSTFMKTNLPTKQKHKEIFQDFVNQVFEESTTYQEDIYIEKNFGSEIFDDSTFEKIKCRVTTMIDSKTGDRINDDYRKIIFKNLSFKPILGSRFMFANNIWLVFDTSNIKTDTSSCYVQRCNNTINMQDKYGNVHREPCIVANKATRSDTFQAPELSVPYNKFIVKYQVNSFTRDIDIGYRLILGRKGYKISQRTEFDKRDTFKKESITLSSWFADLDNTNEYDNLDLEIASYKNFDFSIKTFNDKIIGNIGDVQELKANIYLNGNIFEDELLWTSDNANLVEIFIEDGISKIKLLEYGECTVTATMLNRKDTFQNIKVEIKEEFEPFYENKISPLLSYIKVNKSQNYEVFEYENGNRIDTKFLCEFSGVDEKCYQVFIESVSKNVEVIETNSFTIKNLKANAQNKLKVKCTNQRDVDSFVELDIELGGIL